MELSKTITNLYFHKTTSKDNDTFVGIKTKENKIFFYYPQSYDLIDDSNLLRNQILGILGTLKLTKAKRTFESEKFNAFESGGDFALYSYIWVIRDFLINGYYIERTKVHKKTLSGTIDWKKTIQSSTPLVSDGQIIYKDIYSKVSVVTDEMINEIQRYCLKISIDYIGWLFGLNSNFLGKIPYNKNIKKEYLKHLNVCLRNTFNDNKRLMIEHFKNIIQGLDAYIGSEDIEYGINDYHVVFEEMIRRVFGNRDATKFNPQGMWYLKQADKSYKQVESSDLRPDCILIKEDPNSGDSFAYIVDAKYYSYGLDPERGSLPETSSIQKQITYGDFIKNNSKNPIKNVYNAFILPYNKNHNKFGTNDNLFHFGFAEGDWTPGVANHEIIHAFFIDLKYLIETYNSQNHLRDVDQLIQDILQKTNEFNAIKNSSNP